MLGTDRCLHVVALILFLTTTQPARSQEYIPTPADINRFAQTKTMVVYEQNPMCEYNLTMEDLIPIEWTATPYDFITWKTFESQKTDKKQSFLMLNKVSFEKEKSNARYLFMSLLLGSNAKGLSDMPDLCSVPLAYYNAKEETYVYKIEIFLRFMQNHVRLITGDPSIATKNILQYYNKNVQKLDGKTLYLIASELPKEADTEAEIKKIYNGPFKLVTEDDIRKAIADKDPDVVFLHKVGPGRNQANARCFKILVGAADAQFYYFDYHKIDSKSPDCFLVSDFKKLARKN